MPLPIAIHRYRGFFGDYTPWYAISVGVALAVMAIGLYAELLRLRGKSETKFLLCFPCALLFGVLLASVFDAVFRGTWRTWFGGGTKQFGFVFFGWAIGVLIFVAVWGRLFGFGAKRMIDFYAPLLAVAQAIGRIGCFLGGCCYGVPSMRFGVRYPKGSLPHDMCGDVALFPVQLVESAWLFALFVVCLKVPRRFACAVYLLGVSCGRMIFEFFRYDNRGTVGFAGWMSPSQIVSIVLFLSGLSLLFYASRKCRSSL